MSNIIYIPEEVRETILYMDYIGGITDGKKLFFKELVYVGESDYYLRFRRYVEEEKIESQLVFIRKLFNSYVKLKNDYNNLYNGELNDSFKRFHKGMCTLSITYKNNEKLNRMCQLIDDYRKKRLL